MHVYGQLTTPSVYTAGAVEQMSIKRTETKAWPISDVLGAVLNCAVPRSHPVASTLHTLKHSAF